MNTQVLTRKMYIDNQVSHHQYYSQFVNDGIIADLVNTIGIEKLKDAYSKDKHFNSIPLGKWDAIAKRVPRSTVLLKKSGEAITLSTLICIAKAAAIQIVLQN